MLSFSNAVQSIFLDPQRKWRAVKRTWARYDKICIVKIPPHCGVKNVSAERSLTLRRGDHSQLRLQANFLYSLLFFAELMVGSMERWDNAERPAQCPTQSLRTIFKCISRSSSIHLILGQLLPPVGEHGALRHLPLHLRLGDTACILWLY